MNLSIRRFALATPGLSLLLLLACASTTAQQAKPPSPPPAPSTPAAPAAASADALLPPILALIGEARCTSDQQCRTIGVGHKPCGGPGSYLAWSTVSTKDEAALRSAVARHAQAQREEQERSGMLSDCRAVADPGARCVAATAGDGGGGRCRVNSSAAVGAR